MNSLVKIQNKYASTTFNAENYHIGGGLSENSFASRRHENAKYDQGKLTLGKAAQMFKKATGLDLEKVKEVIHHAHPYLEWHHAGRLPKQYGGGMKKTYFLNAEQIADLAANWKGYEMSILDEKKKEAERAKLERRKAKKRQTFLKNRALRVSRVMNEPKFFYRECSEMHGKYGWFEADYKYNMDVYHSGWAFKSQKSLDKFYEMF